MSILQKGCMMFDVDLLDKSLNEISDLLLEQREKTGKDIAYLRCDGVKKDDGKSMVLTVSLRSK